MNEQYLPLVEQEAKNQGVDPNVAKAMLLTENSPMGSTSPKGAYGLMQVMPDTLKGLVKNGLIDPSQLDLSTPQGQVKAGVAAIKDANNSGINSPLENAVYYNGGPKALSAYRNGQPLNGETADYVQRFAKNAGIKMDDSPESNTSPQTPAANSSNTTTSTMTRLGVTTHQQILPPDMAGSILAKGTKLNDLSAESQAALAQIQAMYGNPKEGIQAQQDLGIAHGQQASAQQTIDLAKNASAQAIPSAFGINLNDPENIIGQNMDIISSTSHERTDLANQIAALQGNGKGFLQDPVGWLANAIQAQPLIARHNALAQQENGAIDNIQTAQKLSTAQTGFQAPMLASGIQEKAIADTNVAMAEAETRRQGLLDSARGKVAQIIMERERMGDTDFRTTIDMARLFGGTQSTTDTVSDRTSEAAKMEDKTLQDVNLSLSAVGLKPLKTVTDLKMLPPDVRAPLMANATNGAIGANPAESLYVLSRMKGNPSGDMATNQPAVYATVNQLATEGQKALETITKSATTNPTGPDATALKEAKTDPQRKLLGITTVMNKYENELNSGDMSTLTPTNPYKIKLASVVADPMLKNNPITQFVAANPTGGPLTDQMILAHMAAEVKNPSSPYFNNAAKASQDIKAFYSEGLNFQRTKTAMDSLGFSNNTNTYPLTAKVYRSEPSKVDMVNAPSLENFLVKEIASSTQPAQQFGQGIGGFR